MKKLFLLLLLLCVTPMLAQSIEYSWKNEEGNVVDLSTLKGKPVILHFWASWCPPCRDEMPELVKWIKKHPEVTVVMISLDSNKENAKSFYEKQGITQPLYMGKMADTSRLGVRGLPSSFIIGTDSEIKKRYIGDVDWADAVVSKDIFTWF